MKKIAVAGLLIAMMGAASAQNVYVGGAIGSANLDVDCNEARELLNSTTTKCSKSRNGYKFHVGYKLNSWLAIEGAYLNYGSVRVQDSVSSTFVDVRTEVESFAANLAFRGELGANFSAVGRVGFGQARVSPRGTVRSNTYTINGSSNEDAIHYGLALEYAFNPRFVGFVSADFADIKDDETGAARLLSAGVQFAF